VGWGSLVWNPGNLPIRGGWLTTGPQVCVEFLRQSNNGRITLVLDQFAAPVQSQWAMMASDDIPKAITALQLRENISPRNADGDTRYTLISPCE
jgi:hypothetical protein